MINTPRIALLLGHIPNPVKTNGQIVKPLGEMPTTRPYKPRTTAPPPDNETPEEARKRQKRENYAASREMVLARQREYRAIRKMARSES